jgi:hypothetical protein
VNKWGNDRRIHTRTMGAGWDEEGEGVAEDVEVGVLVNVLVILKTS